MEVLFICTGNTCRSPMAEAIFNHLCKLKGKRHTSVSCGTNVFFAEPVNKKAIESLSKLGINDFQHYSQIITEDIITSCDIVLTMSSSHKIMLKNRFPKYSSKIFTLNEKAYGKDSDIDDPFGCSIEIYDKCADSIYKAVQRVVDML